jgi:hypothetical protein
MSRIYADNIDPRNSGDLTVAGIATYNSTGADITGIVTATSFYGDVRPNSLEVSGVTTVSAGSTSAPSITPTGDSNTGIFFPSADTIGFAEGGNEVARFDSSGRFGLGTQSPGKKLEITPGSNQDGISIKTGLANYGALDFDSNRSGAGQALGDIRFLWNGTAVARIVSETGSDTTNKDDGHLLFWTASAGSAIERARIDSSGRLLVGTSSVVIDSSNRLIQLSSSDGSFYVAHNSTNNSAADAYLGGIHFSGVGNGSAATSATIEALTDAQWGTGDHPSRLVFSTTADGESSPTERMRIDSQGRMGLGNINPGDYSPVADDLVVGNLSGAHGITIAAENNNTGYLRFADGTANSGQQANGFVQYSHADLSLRFGVDAQERVRIDSSGRLLVGTTTSSTTRTNAIQIAGTGYGAGQLIYRTENTANPPQLYLGKTRATTINSKTIVQNGDYLGVIGFIGADGSNDQEAASITCNVDGTPGASNMPGRISFNTTPAGSNTPIERMRIHNDGILTCQGVYDTTTASAANVNVASSGNLARSTSSAKYKTDVETIEDSYSDALLECRPVWYRSTCEGDNPEHGWWGFIAEEVAEIDPRLVHWKTAEITYDENGSAVETPCDPEPEGVAYDRFVPHLLNLIKRQKEQIETLETQNTTQATAIADLTARIEALEA